MIIIITIINLTSITHILLITRNIIGLIMSNITIIICSFIISIYYDVDVDCDGGIKVVCIVTNLSGEVVQSVISLMGTESI